MSDLLDPVSREIELPNGGTKTFILSKFPAVAGREIVTQYPTSATPKIGNYQLNEELMFKLLNYVAVPLQGDTQIRLSTRSLVDNHVPDFETLMKIEWAMMQYNCSFFNNGKMSGFLELLTEKAQSLILSTLTAFSESSSKKDSQPSKS
jgi:hypothetical protein